MTHPILRPGRYPHWREEARALRRALIERFPEQQTIDRLYHSCGNELRLLNLNQGPDAVWQQALEELAPAGLLPELIKVVEAEGPLGVLTDPVAKVLAAEPFVRTRSLGAGPEVLVLDRLPLEATLDLLGPDNAPARVVLVRGRPKSGKTHGRYLFELAARDYGADPLYLSAGMVADVDEAVMWLFSNLGADDDAIPEGDSTKPAWYLKVSLALLRRVRERGTPVWIAVDDLGPGPDGVPLMDKPIRMFFERLAAQLHNPGDRPWLRLMLIHYPDGTPTGWQRDLWCEDRLDEADIDQDAIVALIHDWAKRRAQARLTDDHVRAIAADLLATAHAATNRPEPIPRLQALHDALAAKLRGLEAAAP